jgi:hypothetical protein
MLGGPQSPRGRLRAARLHELSEADALRFVDAQLGAAHEQKSALLRHRWTSTFQRDWKAEVGHWLHSALRHRFLGELVGRTRSRLHSSSQDVEAELNANDGRQRQLNADLAGARVVHYLCGTGWGFRQWEPGSACPGVDLDVVLRSVTGKRVCIQVKAPDQPGVPAGSWIHDGEYDNRVVGAAHKGSEQLPRDGSDANVVAICPQRVWEYTLTPHSLLAELVGRSLQEDGGIVLPRSRLGCFENSEWAHVSAVMVLDYVRAVGPDGLEPLHGALAILNHNARVQLEPVDFPHARVCRIEGDHGSQRVRWHDSAPTYGSLPAETPVVDA